jgi:hypothetical protein
MLTCPGISRNVSALFQISLYYCHWMLTWILQIIADRSLNHVTCHQLINLHRIFRATCYSFEKKKHTNSYDY